MILLAAGLGVQALVIAFLVADRHVRDRAAQAERAVLLNAAIARHSGDFVALQRAAGAATEPAAHPSAEPTRHLIGLE